LSVSGRLGPVNYPDWDMASNFTAGRDEDDAGSFYSEGRPGLNPDAPEFVLRPGLEAGMQQPVLPAAGGPLNPFAAAFSIKVAQGLNKEFR
jgi:hypothetical protein